MGLSLRDSRRAEICCSRVRLSAEVVAAGGAMDSVAGAELTMLIWLSTSSGFQPRYLEY